MSSETQPLGPALAPPPSADELRVLQADVEALAATIAEREREVAAIRAELRAFEMRYTAAVRPRYAELESLEADIAEALAAHCPDDEGLQEAAREARARADASAGDRVDDLGDDDETASGCHTPSTGLKRLYRRLAFETHPDRSGDEADAELRHELMVEANRAYRDGDGQLLEALLSELEVGVLVGASGDHGRVLRRGAFLRRRLASIDREFEELQATEMFEMWREALIVSEQGRDRVAELAGELDRKLKRARARRDAFTAG